MKLVSNTIEQCHICGECKKMSYEHIPPRSAFNNVPRKMIEMDVFSLNNKDKCTIEGKRYTAFQRGMGLYSLCEKCNSYTGTMYGNEYVKIVKNVGNEIAKIPKENRIGGLNITIEEINCLAFFKQVISMFCSVNSVEFGNVFKGYLLDKENNDFNTEKYKISMYLHNGNIDRISPKYVFWNPILNTSRECSEIAMFPFGYIMYDLNKVSDGIMTGMDITDWGRKEFKSEKVELSLPFLNCNTGKPLDFQ